MSSWERMWRGWIDEGLLPGGAVDIRCGDFHCRAAHGGSMTLDGRQPTEKDTIFDLASLTKVVGTLPGLLILADRERVRWDDPIRRYLPEFRHRDVTVRHLLTHTSGLPEDLPAVPRDRPRDILECVFKQPLEVPPGTRMRYSDLGMILLGELIVRAAGEPLDRFLDARVFRPLGMRDTGFNPPESLRGRIAPTERAGDAWIHGEVHDEKCWQMGGVCGSAGLFSTVGDLALYADAWMNPDEQGVLSPVRMGECLERPFRGRGLGWEIFDRQPPAGCGALWSRGTFGHTGFTGTSLWIDPVRRLSVVLLTNAVHHGRENPIRRLRPAIHDAIFTSLCGSPMQDGTPGN